MTEKLKPCPFCGGTEWTMEMSFVHVSDDRDHIIHCMRCGTQIIPRAESWDRAIEMANRRPEGPYITDIIEEVKMEMCDHYCKWPNLWVEEIEGTTLEDGKCVDCPLGRLS